ncbi:MAG: peptide/nickel transport system ATP-binding [Bacteroidetes bacterium]|nr:MAG: peptide/nickel transport system ATP-binding [Bacteroidota bacterium]
MSDPILVVNNLSISFRNEDEWVTAVDNVSFSLNRKETLGIVGESGSGKSVTSLAIMQLLPKGYSRIHQGEILYSGTEQAQVSIHNLSEKYMRKIRGRLISMIFQEPMTSLNPVMRCGRQITESVKLHLGYDNAKAKKYVLGLFAEVMLPDPLRIYLSYPHQLSGGQKQRVMIAMAIACRPDILIADEPTTALDVTVQKNILLLLKSLQQKHNMSLIFISHDLGVISEIADNVVVMNRGKIVEQGAVNDVFLHPQNPYTQGLIACRPPLDRRLKRLPVVSDFINGKNQAIDAVEIISPEERKLAHIKLYEGNPLLSVDGLKVYYKTRSGFLNRNPQYFKAVDDVSLQVYKGETLGLVGESGCGKTTLGRAILRLLEPTEGKVIYDGKDLSALNQEQLRKMRQRIQIIFQDPYSALNPRITIGDAIMEPMIAHGLLSDNNARRTRVMHLLSRVGLEENSFERFPHQFSGGQRQRISIARALALDPEFIICDESVSALDVSVQAQVLNLLNDLKKDFGFTYIFISHDLSVVRFMSDRILVMRNGKIVESGEADDLYNNPKEIYTRELIRAIPGI